MILGLFFIFIVIPFTIYNGLMFIKGYLYDTNDIDILDKPLFFVLG